jgi:hypothetical protein
MNAPIRTAVVALVVGLLTLGVFGLRFACSPGDYERFLQESRRQEELRDLKQAISRREEAIRQATHDYIAERCTLAESIQRLRQLEQEWLPSADHNLVRETSGMSDEKRHYELIMNYVRSILRGRSEELATVVRRLEKDYQRLQAGRQTPSTAATKRAERSR